MNKTTIKEIKKVILDGYKENLTYSQIAKKIKTDVFKDLAQGYRSKLVARTEAHGMVENGSFEAAKASKVVKEKTWSSAGDARPTHGDANGQTILVEDTFIVGGYKMNYPGDTSYGAGLEEIIHCRCSALYSAKIHEDRLTNSKDLIARYEEQQRLKLLELPKVSRRGHIDLLYKTDKEGLEKRVAQLMEDAKNAGVKMTKEQAKIMAGDIRKFVRDYAHVRRYETGTMKVGEYLTQADINAYAKISKEVNNFIKLAPKYNGEYVYRSLNLSAEQTKIFANMKIGKLIDMKGTSFFTSSKDVSSIFGDQVRFVIRNPKGGTSITHFSQFGIDGQEVLFGRDAKFKITQINKIIADSVKSQKFEMFAIKRKGKREILEIYLEEILPKAAKVPKLIVAKPKISLETMLSKNKVTSSTKE